MPEIDPNLIAALAEGILDSADAAAAAIAADPRATAELTYQRAALSAIAAAPSVRLSDEERHSLRTAVAGAVNLELDPEPKRTRSRRRSAPWGAIAVAAVSLTAIVAIVPLVGLLSTGDSGNTAATVFGAAPLTTVVSQAVDDLGATADETPTIGGEERTTTHPREAEPSATTTTAVPNTTAAATTTEGADISAAPTLPLTSESGLTTTTAPTVSPGENDTSAATGPEERLRIPSFSDADGAALYQAWVADPEAAADRPPECDIVATQQLGDESELLVVPVEIGEIDPKSALAYLAVAGDDVTDLFLVDGTTCLAITP